MWVHPSLYYVWELSREEAEAIIKLTLFTVAIERTSILSYRISGV
jgi:hypothetical protein